MFFFFKQKTAYEMRISDWSSDVCSSDLAAFYRAGLPKGLFQHLFLTHDQTARIIAGGHVDQVNFTGSVDGGRAIERAAAGTFTGLGLELGGKDPAHVRAVADMGRAGVTLGDGAVQRSSDGMGTCG